MFCPSHVSRSCFFPFPPSAHTPSVATRHHVRHARRSDGDASDTRDALANLREALTLGEPETRPHTWVSHRAVARLGATTVAFGLSHTAVEPERVEAQTVT